MPVIAALAQRLRLVVGLVLADGLEQQIVLDLVRIGRGPRVFPNDVFFGLPVTPEEARMIHALANVSGAFRAVQDAAGEVPATGDVPALGEHPRAVRKRVFHGVVVEQLVGLGADLPPALSLGGNRPGVLRPAADIHSVDQPVQLEGPVEPGKVAVVADLMGQFARAGRFGREAHRRVLAVGPAGDDLADDAIVDRQPPRRYTGSDGSSNRRR